VPSRSWRRALAAAALGGLTGALAGFLMPRVVLDWYNRAEARSAGDLTRSVLMHLGLWVPLGAAAGLGFGVGRTERKRWGITLVGGAVGVAIGTLGYDLLGAFFFPLAETGKPISEAWATRLMAFLLVPLTAAAATLAVAETKSPAGPSGKAAAPPPPP
jgi:hypothetical protein